MKKKKAKYVSIDLEERFFKNADEWSYLLSQCGIEPRAINYEGTVRLVVLTDNITIIQPSPNLEY